MSASELLAELNTLGASLSVEGEHLRVVAPRGAVSPELRRRLAAGKEDLVRLLRPRPGTCHHCGRPAAANLLFNCDDCADALHANQRPPPAHRSRRT